jgi:hypothetical protein
MKLKELLNEAEAKSEGQQMYDWFKNRVRLATGKVANHEKLDQAVKITPGGKASIRSDITVVHVDTRKVAPTKKALSPPFPLQKLFSSRHKIFSVDYTEIPGVFSSDLLIDAHWVSFNSCDLPALYTFAPLLPNVVGLSFNKCNVAGGLMNVFKFPKLQWIGLHWEYNGTSYDHDTAKKVSDIISKHLKSEERSMVECMDELIEKGYKEFAKS